MIEGNSENSLGIGQVARRAGVSADTLRHYEAKGVIKRAARQANGYRIYPPETLARVELVRRSLALGFTLDELAEVLHERDHGGVPCRRVRDLAATKLGEVEQRLNELILLRDELRNTLKEWDSKLAKTPKNQRSRLLENLNRPSSLQPRRKAHFTTTTKKERKRT